MAEESYPNFKTLCRLCLQAETAEINIFQKKNCPLSIPVRIMACAALEVQSIDGLPKSICAECRYQLEKSYYFRKRSQLSDSKLKKHLRLVNLGKKSRIFNKTEEENLEDELEFIDSLNFIKEQDADRAKKEEQELIQLKNAIEAKVREEVRSELEDKIRNEVRLSIVDEVKLELRNVVKEEVRDEVWRDVKNEIRHEVWNEVKTELKQEVVMEVRENIKQETRDECLLQAKLELRSEVKEECREEELETLLDALGDFLKSKRLKKKEPNSKNLLKSDNQPDVDINRNQNATKIDSKPVKAVEHVSEADRKILRRQIDEPIEGSTSVNEITSTEQATSLMIMESEVEDNIENETASNFFIIEDNEGEEDEENVSEQKVQDAANTYFAEDESANFQVSDSSQNSTTYQIEDNGDIKFFKKEMDSQPGTDEIDENDSEQNILIFDADFEQDESEDQIMEFDEMPMEKEIVIKRATDTYTPSKNSKPRILRTNVMTKTFQCSDCPQLFASESSMRRHMMMHEKLEQKGVSHSCSVCHIFFSCKSSLNRHMLKHTSQRPFRCEECGKSFIQREILKRHLLTHSGVRPFECPHCERSFMQKLNLKQHIEKLHTDNPKVQQYSCHLCPKRFNHASGLSRHLATHSGVSFQCPECERTFSDRSSVKRHIVHMHKEIEISSN